MSRTIVIGDVHGMRGELEELLSKLALRAGDRVIFCGDICDKGPDSLGSLRLARETIAAFPGSVCVSGNHEEKASRQFKRGISVEPWVEDATEADWAFIDSMPLTWFDAELDLRVVHGGIFPALLEKHPDVFSKIEARGNAWRKGGGKAMNRARRILRVRQVGKDSGDMLSLTDAGPEDPFWTETYDGSEGFVVFGHAPQKSGEPLVSDHALGIDTGAVFGAKLTAAVFTGPREFSLVTVQASGSHADWLKDMGEE